MTFTVRGIQPVSVFGLTGADENSATFAMGWVLEQCPAFRKAVLKAMFGTTLDTEGLAIALQRHGNDGGYTDIEIQSGTALHAIFEAKRWWEVPSLAQLHRYHPRLAAGGAENRRIVSISAADARYARRRLPEYIDDVALHHFSWGDLQNLAVEAARATRNLEQKLWLRQFAQHLREFVSMERLIDNKVYVVSLGSAPMVEGSPHTWIDVVEKDGCYFHPIGKTWPMQPPNYIAFRYRGKLQSVHHINSFEVVDDLPARNPLWIKNDTTNFVYRLGPPMRPVHDLKTGNLYMTARVWCAIDTLLSGQYDTISAARDETQRRLAEML